MRCFIGIDLGSTTTKSVVIDENCNILGRGITNSRSNYDTAAAIAKQEALVNARFHLFREGLSKAGGLDVGLETFLGQLERDFRLEQFLEQLADLEEVCGRNCAGPRFGADAKADAGGNMDVQVRHLVRRALPSLTACVLERASARYALAESSPRFAYTRGITQPPFAASFIEYIPPV